ncbi:hypothetical protein [Inquilinus sp. CAU 1745]|uniref:hypothetical protein n=1 Tax=Inquilinus sp. CAU 1745 TaxID=3140369 RepID=UPI00325C0AD8
MRTHPIHRRLLRHCLFLLAFLIALPAMAAQEEEPAALLVGPLSAPSGTASSPAFLRPDVSGSRDWRTGVRARESYWLRSTTENYTLSGGVSFAGKAWQGGRTRAADMVVGAEASWRPLHDPVTAFRVDIDGRYDAVGDSVIMHGAAVTKLTQPRFYVLYRVDADYTMASDGDGSLSSRTSLALRHIGSGLGISAIAFLTPAEWETDLFLDFSRRVFDHLTLTGRVENPFEQMNVAVGARFDLRF